MDENQKEVKGIIQGVNGSLKLGLRRKKVTMSTKMALG